MNTHTEGPWEWQSFDGGKTVFLGTPNRGRLVVLDGLKGLRFSLRDAQDKGGIMKTANGENIANFPDARLIAAAPELFNACKMLAAASSEGMCGAVRDILNEAIYLARAAILKVEADQKPTT